MVGRRGDDGGAGGEPDPSPWATDQIVAGPAPHFAWEQPPSRSDEAASDPSDSGRRNQVIVALGCVAALVLGTVALWPNSGEPTAPADSVGDTETTLGTLPGADETATDSATSEDEPTQDAEDADDDILANAPGPAAGVATPIVLPEAVAAISEPTEIVFAGTSEIITVSLPSGSVRRVAASGMLDSGLVVAPDAVAWFGGSNVNIVPRIGPALTVDLGTGSAGGGYINDWVTDETGSTRFLVSSFGQMEEQLYTVSVDGEADEYEPDFSRLDTFAFYGGLQSGAGNEIVNDAGGVYLIGVGDDIERISTGRALAANDGFVLLRECDESLVCGYLVLDRTTRERRPSPATTELLGVSYGFDLAPDGTAAVAYDFRGQERRLVDLVEGSVVAELERPIGSGRNTQWAADSSGVFEADPNGQGLRFTDRESGESVQFAPELGRIIGLGVRMPDSELDSADDTLARRPITFSDGPPGATGLDLVVLGELESMAHLDLDAALASVWSVPATTGQHAPDLVAIGSEVLVIPSSGSDAFVSTLGGATPLTLPEDAQMPGYPRFPGSTPSAMWSPRDGVADGVDHEMVEIDDGGAPVNLGGAIKLANSELLGEDGTGRLIARVGGDIFVVAVIGTTRLTDGDLVALGPNHALVRTCDDSLRCTTDRVDRATGNVLSSTRRTPDVDQALTEARSVIEPGRSPRLSGTISPDGEAVVVRSGAAGNTDQWILVDFATGSIFDVPSPANGQPIIWSDDSSAAVYVGDGDVHVIERPAERATTMRGLGEVRSITAVGADFAGDAPSGG